MGIMLSEASQEKDNITFYSYIPYMEYEETKQNRYK